MMTKINILLIKNLEVIDLLTTNIKKNTKLMENNNMMK